MSATTRGHEHSGGTGAVAPPSDKRQALGLPAAAALVIGSIIGTGVSATSCRRAGCRVSGARGPIGPI